MNNPVRKKNSLILPMLLAAALVGALSVLAFAPRAEGVAACTGKQVYPGQNLADVAANTPAGTTFCVRDGSYTIGRPIAVQDNDRFFGVYNDGSRPSIKTTQALHVFDARGSHGATIRGLMVSGATGGNYCEPNCGRGIGGGSNLTVDDVRATGNKNQGIGGTGPGLLVTNSEVDRNGSYSFVLDGGVQSAAGIKAVNSMTVLNSYVHDNYWSGVWCDNECGAFQVKNSTLVKNGKSGIHYEASSGPAVFSGNRIQGNGINQAVPGKRAGLIIYAGSNVDVFGNTFGQNTFYGIQAAEDDRTWSKPMANVRLHDNTMNGNKIVGCRPPVVVCQNNTP